MITKQLLQKLKAWHYPCISSYEIMRMSGWKFYVFGETVEDSVQVCTLLTPVMKNYNLTMKVATQHIIDRNQRKKGIAWSIAVIYLHAEIFQQQRVGNLLEDINTSLLKYPKTGFVNGAKSINGKVHYRYDLTIPIDPAKGASYEKYTEHYRGEHGDFNIPENNDITSFLKK